MQLLSLQCNYYHCNATIIIAMQLLSLQCNYYHCNTTITFAIQLLSLQYNYYICNATIIIAMQLLSLQCSYYHCNATITTAVMLLPSYSTITPKVSTVQYRRTTNVVLQIILCLLHFPVASRYASQCITGCDCKALQ